MVGEISGRRMAPLLLKAGLAEFERDLLRERVRSGVTAAQVRGPTVVNTSKIPIV